MINWKNVQSDLSNLKSKAGKLDVDKLVGVPVLLHLSGAVKHDVVNKDVYDAQIKIWNRWNT